MKRNANEKYSGRQQGETADDGRAAAALEAAAVVAALATVAALAAEVALALAAVEAAEGESRGEKCRFGSC